MSSATAVIPVWNRRDLLERLFDSMDRQTTRFAEVIAVDNASEDGAGDFAEQRGARVVRLSQNEGFAKAVNRGIRECRTELVAILNSDVELDQQWLGVLESSMTEDAWFATGKILQFGSDDVLDGTFDLVCRGACSWRAGAGRRVSEVFEKPRRIAIAPMTAALFRRRLFDDVGWLDERFESYLEDTDFGLRCAAAGHGGRYVPGAVAWHRGSASLGRWNHRTVRLISRNQMFLAAKHIRRLNLAVILAQGLWGLVAARHGQFSAWISGKQEGWHRRGEFAKQALPDSVLVELERELYRLQAMDGMDAYWRLYFLFAGKVA